MSLVVLLGMQSARAAVPAIDQVMAFPGTFKPFSTNRHVTIKYSLSAAAAVRLTIYGPEQEQIKVLRDWAEKPAGQHTVNWDGKDDAGTVVPDEAYFFTIEAKNQDGATVYDPIIHSGGKRITPDNVKLDPVSHEISYTLSESCRVLVRVGIYNGPLCDTVINWLPRQAGVIQEKWNGEDRLGVRKHFVFSMNTLIGSIS